MTPDERRSLNADMARLAQGDRRLLDSVARRLDPNVRAFCDHRLGAGADAEDAAQNALAALFGRANEFDPGRDVLAWAFTIAAWECRTIRKRRSRSRTGPLDHEPESPLGGPEADAEQRQRLEVVEAAARALRDADRDVLEAVLDELRGDATFRKRKERMVDRLRAFVRRTYDLGE